jgi:hypothetical protein
MKMTRFGGVFTEAAARRFNDCIAKGRAAPNFKNSLLLKLLIPSIR